MDKLSSMELCRPSFDESEAERARQALGLLKARGVMATLHNFPLHSFPRGRSLAAGDLPVTDRITSTLLRLPVHPLLSEEDGDRVVTAVRATLP